MRQCYLQYCNEAALGMPMPSLRVPKLKGGKSSGLVRICSRETAKQYQVSLHSYAGAEGSPDASRAPSVPDVAPQLAAMSMEDVTQLLGDEDKYVAFVQSVASKAHIVKVQIPLSPHHTKAAPMQPHWPHRVSKSSHSNISMLNGKTALSHAQ